MRWRRCSVRCSTGRRPSRASRAVGMMPRLTVDPEFDVRPASSGLCGSSRRHPETDSLKGSTRPTRQWLSSRRAAGTARAPAATACSWPTRRCRRRAPRAPRLDTLVDPSHDVVGATLRHVEVGDHRRVGVAEVDADDLGAARCELEAQRVRDRPERRLGRAVRIARGVPAERGVDVDERAAAVGGEHRRERLRDGERAEDVGLEQRPHLVEVCVEHRRGGRAPALFTTMVVSRASAATAAMDAASVTSSSSGTTRSSFHWRGVRAVA